MQPKNVRAMLQNTHSLQATPDTATEQAAAAMNILADFNLAMVGLANFSGMTPWEWHPEDELLLVFEGRVSVEILPPEGASRTHELGPDDVIVVPARHWHRQHAHVGTRLLFVTSREGNAESRAVDPRADRGPS